MNFNRGMKGLLLLALAATTAASASAAPSPRYKIRWLLAHDTTAAFATATDKFAEIVSRETGGEVQVVAVSASDAEPTGRVHQSVAAGKFEMGQAYSHTLGDAEPRFRLFDMPFLFSSDREIFEVFEGAVGEGLLDRLSSTGVRGLGFTYSGGREVLSAPRPVRTPADLKGLKVGAFGNPVLDAWLRGQGATLMAMGPDFPKAGELIKAGTSNADSALWPYWVFYKDGFEKTPGIFPYATELFAAPRVSVIVINETFFASLPKRHQAAVRKAASLAAKAERADTIRRNDEGKRKMESRGLKIATLSAAERAAFRAAAQPVYDRFAASVGLGALKRTPTPQARRSSGDVEGAR
ncbi:MAG: TRAP transporter substrate-binding protein DctP [Elusimicrobia bacterium]|nr:TRAP transporter substrate-binding protein DctP [Elusimicrobiota bacterium]